MRALVSYLAVFAGAAGAAVTDVGASGIRVGAHRTADHTDAHRIADHIADYRTADYAADHFTDTQYTDANLAHDHWLHGPHHAATFDHAAHQHVTPISSPWTPLWHPGPPTGFERSTTPSHPTSPAHYSHHTTHHIERDVIPELDDDIVMEYFE